MSSRARSGAAQMRSAALASLRPRSSSAPAPRRIASTHAFRGAVWRYWRENGRHNLPWRKTHDPYKILVSEVMLQQTQVDRVIPKYKEFLRRFPTVKALASASLVDVLKIWSGLGYNRRAKYLRDAATMIVEKHNGRMPTVYSELVELPGVGDYTARAIRVFAFNEPDVLIETNVRTALIHAFFPLSTRVADQAIMTLLSKVTDNRKPSEWHWALMDYGAHLKRSGVRNNHRSAHYVKQSKFEGSLRQIRGEILRTYSQGGKLSHLRNRYGSRFSVALTTLIRDELVPKREGASC